MTTEMRKRRSYTEDFKRDAAALVTEQGYKPCMGQLFPDTLLNLLCQKASFIQPVAAQTPYALRNEPRGGFQTPRGEAAGDSGVVSVALSVRTV